MRVGDGRIVSNGGLRFGESLVFAAIEYGGYISSPCGGCFGVGTPRGCPGDDGVPTLRNGIGIRGSLGVGVCLLRIEKRAV